MICVRSMNERCDQIVHCKDKSDEEQCALLVFGESYNNKVPPFNINTTDNSIIPVKVRVSTSLRNVLQIAEFSHTIDLKLGITLKWYENRVLYHNLKIKEAFNVLSDSEVSTGCPKKNALLCFFLAITPLWKGLEIKEGGVLKNSGNSLSDRHQNFSI